MHELSVAQALIEQLEQVAATNHAKHVTRVSVMVGSLSGVDPDALRMAFPLAAEATVAHGAELRLEAVPARAFCKDCDVHIDPEFPFFVCDRCGSNNVEITSGRELVIQSVDLEINEEKPSGQETKTP